MFNIIIPYTIHSFRQQCLLSYSLCVGRNWAIWKKPTSAICLLHD